MEKDQASIQTLHHLLDYQAGKFTAAEVLLKNNLREWISKSGSLPLKTVLQKYLDFVEEHVQKLEVFIENEKITSLEVTDRIMKAFIEEANEQMSCCSDTEVKDACLLACVQGINHFKISVYGTAAAFAKTLKNEKAATTFLEMEVNEKQIDERLSRLAEYEINRRAEVPFVITG